MNEKFLADVLATDKRIRYVGIVTDDLKNLMSKTKDAGKMLIDKAEAEEKLVMLVGPVILGALGQVSNKCGNLICAGARFDNLTLMFFKMGDVNVVVSTDPIPPYAIMEKLENKFMPNSKGKCGLQKQPKK